MDIKCSLICLVLILSFANCHFIPESTPETPEQVQCFHIYDCCRKVEFDCVEYCEPLFVCTNNSTNQDLGFEKTQKTAVIVVGLCRKGFKVDGTGKCRRML